jgi:hypothetical protein
MTGQVRARKTYAARLKDGRRWVCGAPLCRGQLPMVGGIEGDRLLVHVQGWHLGGDIWCWGSGRRRRFASRLLRTNGKAVRVLEPVRSP